jgi:hypothetical protein
MHFGTFEVVQGPQASRGFTNTNVPGEGHTLAS